jgi:hypothetical protein
MGSNMRKEIFTEHVTQGLKNWHKKAKQSLSKSNNNSVSLHSRTSENSVRRSLSIESMHSNNKVENVSVRRSLSIESMHNNNKVENVSVRRSLSIESMHNNNKVENEDMQSPKVIVVTSPPPGNNSGSGEEEEIVNVASVEQEISSESTSEMKTVEENNGKIITRGIYDGEISFGVYVGSSSRGIGEIVSIAEEEDDDTIDQN